MSPGRRTAISLATILAVLPASAATFQSGTGFFVGRGGEVLTNAHVVEGCGEIVLRGPFGTAHAEVSKLDRAGDIALLRTDYRPIHVARLRADEGRLQPGDKVSFLGYPAEHALSGTTVLTDSKIIALYGPLREPDFVQFDDSAQHGNSGGALLDLSGEVVGMVTAKSVVTRDDPTAFHGRAEEKSDIAVTLPALKRFLENAGVAFQQEDSQIYLSQSRQEELAEGFTTQVACEVK